MYSSLLKTPGDWFADFDLLQDRLDELLGVRSGAPSSIRAVGRAGAFPPLNVGTGPDAVEIYALAPGVDAKSIDVSVEKGVLAISGERQAIATTNAVTPLPMRYGRTGTNAPAGRAPACPNREKVGAKSYPSTTTRCGVPILECVMSVRSLSCLSTTASGSLVAAMKTVLSSS